MHTQHPTILSKGTSGKPCPIAKTLSLRLRELEANKIVERTVYPEVPPRVEYKLTEKGKQLEHIFVELKRFGLTLG